MYKKIIVQLAMGGEKEIPLLTTGTTSYRYKHLFGEEPAEALGDVLKNLEGTQIAALQSGDFGADSEMAVMMLTSGKLSMIGKLAFIMNAQAEKKDMPCLTFDDYLDWMDQFESMEMIFHAEDILGLYIGSRKSDSHLKKSPGQQSGR